MKKPQCTQEPVSLCGRHPRRPLPPGKARGQDRAAGSSCISCHRTQEDGAASPASPQRTRPLPSAAPEGSSQGPASRLPLPGLVEVPSPKVLGDDTWPLGVSSLFRPAQPRGLWPQVTVTGVSSPDKGGALATQPAATLRRSSPRLAGREPTAHPPSEDSQLVHTRGLTSHLSTTASEPWHESGGPLSGSHYGVRRHMYIMSIAFLFNPVTPPAPPPPL